jgi:DNA modification methylase
MTRVVVHSGIGAPNGPRRDAFARWFRYPAGFSADTLALCFDALAIEGGSILCDPFAGVASAGVYATSLGHEFVGLEVHPLIAEIAALKFSRPGNSEDLMATATELIANAAIATDILEHSLVTRSFEATTLARLVGLRMCIQNSVSPWAPYLKWCLLGALRDCASVRVGWPYQRPGATRAPRILDPDRALLRRAQWMADDLRQAPGQPRSTICIGDARSNDTWVRALNGHKAAAIVTSPPYLNNFDYADATRLELYFWRVVASWSEMCENVRRDMLISSTQQSRKRWAQESADKFQLRCPSTSLELTPIIESLHAERMKRNRGKEYDWVVPSYFHSLSDVVLRIRDHTKDGSPIIFVLGDSAPYGVYINTPELLSKLAVELGFTCTSVRQLRRRGLRWSANGTRHSVELAESMVLLRAPGPL